MDGFSEKQLQQFRSLLLPLECRLCDVEARLSDIDRQQGDLWETNMRQAVREDLGRGFAKEFAVVSLQHLARLICRSNGWTGGADAVDICRVSEKLVDRLLDGGVAEKLLRRVFDALITARGNTALAELGRIIKSDPWFDNSGGLDVTALKRSLSLFADKDSKHIGSKVQKLYHCLSAREKEGIKFCPVEQDQEYISLLQCVTYDLSAGEKHPLARPEVAHLLTCRSAGVMLALFAAEPSKYDFGEAETVQELAQIMPFLQLQFDVRGKITMIKNQVTIEVGEIKRNVKQYKEAKAQLVQRVKLLQWAIDAVVDDTLDFVLIGHLFVPRSIPADAVPKDEITDSVSIFVHRL